MSFLRHRSSAASNNDSRLSYLHGPEQTTEYLHTFDPRKNLNDLFKSLEDEVVRMENLRVFLRVRPSLQGEVNQDEDTQVNIVDERSIILTAPACSNTFKNSFRGITKLTHKFTFSHVYGPSTSQEELFQSSTCNLVKDFLCGQNCLLFTYGATNSGKTFTVQGTQEDAGLLPRTVQHIFTTVGENQYPKNDLKPKFSCDVTRLEEQDIQREEEKRESIFRIPSNLTNTLSQSTMSLLKSDETLNSTVQLSETSAYSNNTTDAGVSPVLDSLDATNTTTRDSTSPGKTIYAVYVSFAEIYNEYIYDLLERMPTSKGSKRNPLMMGEDYKGAVYIKGLNEVRVRTADEALQLVNIGRQNLHFAATRLNHNSSRSHCIFTVKLLRLADADNPHVARVSVLSMCDLAGAERAAKTCNTQDRLKESGNINTSLLTLSRCIEALRYNQSQKSNKKPVPYRDSKLTRLFQSFLLGRGKAAMIVNVSRIPLLFDETLQVLKFAAVAKQVAISQDRESEVQVVQHKKRVNRLSKMVRQSLKGTGRLSVPWSKTVPTTISFGDSVCEEKDIKKEEDLIEEEDDDDDEDEDEEDERVKSLIQITLKLKEELAKEHKEKLDLKERMKDFEESLRQELCKEFSVQLVEIQNSWSQRLKDQENRYEELTEYKMQALMKSVKKCNKRMRCEEDPDEEYIPSIHLFREQRKVEEQKLQIEELESEVKLLKEENQALMEAQKKTNEMATQACKEKSKLTFKLAQLTTNYDKRVQELKEIKSLNISASSDNAQVIQELQAQLDAKNTTLQDKDKEIQELQSMLLEAAEGYTDQEKKCSDLEKLLQSSQRESTQHMMYINELESKLEGSREMLSQQATLIEEREQDLEDSRQLLSQERKSNMQQLGKKEQQIKKMQEDHMREMSKLLLEIGGLKRNKPAVSSGSTEELKALEEKVLKLQEEKDAMKKSEKAFEEEVLKLQEEKKAVEKNKEALEEEVSWLQEDKESMKTNKKSLEEKVANLLEGKETMKKSEDDLKEEVSKLKEENEVLKKNEKNLEEEATNLKEEKETMMKYYENLEKKVSQIREEKEALEKDEETLKENLEKDVTEKEELIKSLEEKITVTEKELSEVKAEFKESMQEKEDKLEELMKRIEESTSQHEELDIKQSEINKLMKENKSLSKEIQNLKAISENLDDQLEDAKNTLKEKETAEGKLAEDLSECKAELEKLEKSNASLKEQVSTSVRLQEKYDANKAELESLKSAYAVLKEKEAEEAELHKTYDKCRTELEELQKSYTSLQEQMESKAEIQESFATCKTELEELQKAYTELKDDKKSLEMKLQDQITSLETIKAETETKLKEKDDQIASRLAECNKLRSEVKEIETRKVNEEEDTTHKLSGLREVNAKLETQVQQMKEEKVKVEAEKEMIEVDKRKMAERLYNLQEASQVKAQQAQVEISTLQEQTEILIKQKLSLENKVEQSHRVQQEQTKLAEEKHDVVLALSSKIESLDSKLNKAEEEGKGRKHLEEELGTARDGLKRLEIKCELLEKECRALKEARAEESSSHEEFARQKDLEVSTLQQEVKKLLQQSMCSSRSSIADASTSASVKAEVPKTPEANDELVTLKEQLRLTVNHNSSLIQEVSNLRNQVARLSTSESSVLQLSASKASSLKKQRVALDASPSDKEFVTPVPKESSRRKNRVTIQTPNNSSYMDSSVGDERQHRDAPVPLSPSPAPSNTSGRPQRSVRRTMRYDSQEYELGYKHKSEDDDTWQPNQRVSRGSQRTRTRQSKTSSVPKAYLQDQENKSSMANKADLIQEPEPETKSGRKKPSASRRKRILYNNEDAEEPFLCDPDLVVEAPPEDSPMTTVRRQLRNKRK